MIRPFLEARAKICKKNSLVFWSIGREEKILLRLTDSNFSLLIHTLQDFVLGLSILVKGTLDEKLRWMFALYDQDKDGYISRYETRESKRSGEN